MNRSFLSIILILSAFVFLSFKGTPKPKTAPSPFPGYTSMPNGTYFKQFVKGSGTVSPDSGGALFLKVKFLNARDSMLLDVNVNAKMPSFPILITKPAFDGDFQYVFAKLHQGDSVGFFMRLDSLKSAYPGQFDFHLPAIDTLKYLGFFVKVDSVFTRSQVDTLKAKETRMKMAEQARQQKIQSVMNAVHSEAALKETFLKAHNDSMLKPGLEKYGFVNAKPDENGIYYRSVEAGTSTTTCQLFQKVTIRYTGTYLDGTIFDSNELAEGQQEMSFTLGLDQMIPGFTKCIYKMHPGEKALFILPPNEAYHDGLTRVFSVEVIGVQNTH